MHPFVTKSVKKAKLSYLWITRILLAPDRFGIPVRTRLRLAVTRGFVPDQFVIYDLKRNSADDFLSEFDWYRSRYINQPFDSMLNNKVVCTQILQEHVSMPPILFLNSRGRLMLLSRGQHFATIDDAIAQIRAVGVVFMKPIGNGKGHGVHRIDSVEEEFLVDGQPASEAVLRQLLGATDDWFLNGFVEQCRELADIYDKTSNTIRLITLRDPGTGEVQVFFAVLRLGTSSTVPVDNGSRGGLVAKIDLKTGVTSEARSLWSTDTYAAHPDSGASIEGFEIPGWEALKRQMVELAERFPYLQFVAWDILLADDGPWIIEANTSSGVNIIQLWGPQRNGALGEFYRAHGVIR